MTEGLDVAEVLRASETYWNANCWGVWLEGFVWSTSTAELVDAFQNDVA